ncbi:WhiB family transcriptional regulator [Streptomyces sp. NPDC006458]|uniref:WhiB family transcriptional regulator n=1 Tax=Streptomyces sp. NPDC006458 TaxID=3154302 RepID=UPI0033AD1CD9
MDREWELMAACRPLDPDVFFSPRTLGLARQTCRDCPVRPECLESALTREADVAKTFRTGIVAGLTGAQRWEIDKQRKAPVAAAADEPPKAKPKPTGRPRGTGLARCGTRAAYQRHLRNGESVDEACRAANARGAGQYRHTGSTQIAAGR